MRKYTRIGTFLLALVMCLTMLTAQAESELPEEVADLFTVKAWAHYAIANQPDMPENKAFAVMQEKSGYEAALLVMRNTKSETNVLVLAEKSSAQADWKITMRNRGAVGQGDAAGDPDRYRGADRDAAAHGGKQQRPVAGPAD